MVWFGPAAILRMKREEAARLLTAPTAIMLKYARAGALLQNFSRMWTAI